MNNMKLTGFTNTPRTDAADGTVIDGCHEHPQEFSLDPKGKYVTAEFARKLELENAELLEALKGLAFKSLKRLK